MADLKIHHEPSLSASHITKSSGGSHHVPTTAAAPPTPDTPTSPKARPKTSNILTRFSFARSKGIIDLAMQDLEKLRQAEKAEMNSRKDVEARERKMRKVQEQKERGQIQKAAKELAKQRREEKAETKAEDKRLKDCFGGTRGYNPNAGILSSDQGTVAEGNAQERALTATQSHQPPSLYLGNSQNWGLEFGKPEDHRRKGHFSGHHEYCGERYGGKPAI